MVRGTKRKRKEAPHFGFRVCACAYALLRLGFYVNIPPFMGIMLIVPQALAGCCVFLCLSNKDKDTEAYSPPTTFRCLACLLI